MKYVHPGFKTMITKPSTEKPKRASSKGKPISGGSNGASASLNLAPVGLSQKSSVKTKTQAPGDSMKGQDSIAKANKHMFRGWQILSEGKQNRRES